MTKSLLFMCTLQFMWYSTCIIFLVHMLKLMNCVILGNKQYILGRFLVFTFTVGSVIQPETFRKWIFIIQHLIFWCNLVFILNTVGDLLHEKKLRILITLTRIILSAFIFRVTTALYSLEKSTPQLSSF